jgi:multiple sugar transport system ATP-binding protein
MQVKLTNLTMEFKDVVAVNSVNITIPSGKLVGLLGPSGCGKSTTLYMISGLYRPTRGQIFFDSNNVTNVPPEKRGIGLVFQNYALYPHMSVKQNILFPLENAKMSRRAALDRVNTVARLVQIDTLLDRKPSQLSGGQQQRVAIARALAKNPQVLLLDEPLSNLDARLRIQTRDEIKKIQQRTGVTTLFVTHDQEEAMSICDLIVVMKEGIVQQVGAPQDVYRQPENLFVAKFLGNPEINTFNALVVHKEVFVSGTDIGGVTYDIYDGDYIVGVRPESFKIDHEKGFVIDIDHIEIIGRDSMIHFRLQPGGPLLKAIVDSDDITDIKSIKLSVKPGKIYIFDRSNERAIYK